MNKENPDFDELVLRDLNGLEEDSDGSYNEEERNPEDDEYDERYDEILDAISSMKEISASFLQRKFRLGYPRASRLIEIFEKEGVVGPAHGGKPRKVLINKL